MQPAYSNVEFKAKITARNQQSHHEKFAHKSLAMFFNFEISGLADKFLMEMVRNVNNG